MIKIVEKIINNYRDELTDEEAFYLWDRWNRMVRYNCVPEWEDDVWSFVEFAVSRGFELGEKVKRKDFSAPYSPDNCVFESGERGALPPKKKQPKIETSEVKALADRWNKCVYAPNRERVEKYRKTATQEPPDPGSKRHCSWCYDDSACTIVALQEATGAPQRITLAYASSIPGACLINSIIPV